MFTLRVGIAVLLLAAFAISASCSAPHVQSNDDAGEDVGDAGAGVELSDSGTVDAGDGGEDDDAGFEQIELSCDGHDNDGDGVVDVSRAITLGEQRFPYAFTWAADEQQVYVAYDRDGGPLVDVYDRTFARRGSFVIPSPNTFFTAPRVAPMSQGAALAWVTVNSGIGTHWVTRLLSDGGFGFSAATDAGAFPMHRRYDQPINNGDAFNVVVSRDEQCLLLWWNDSCDGWFSRGAVLSPSGEELAAPTGLYPVPSGGDYCNLFDAFSIVPWGDAGFALFGGTVFSDGGQREISMKTYDCGLNELSASFVALPGGSHPVAYASNAGKVSDDVWLVEGTYAPTAGPLHGWRLSDGTSAEVVGLTDGAPAYSAKPHMGTRGAFSTYVVVRASAPLGNVGVAHPFDGGTDRVIFSQSSNVGHASPLSLELGPDRFVVGLVVDAGSGQPFAQQAHIFCAP